MTVGRSIQIERRRVGQTTLEVTALGLGGATLGGVADVGDSDARAIVDTAFEAGVSYFDTAPQYGYGKSERIVGDGLRARQDWVVSTKVGRLLRPFRHPRRPDDVWHQPLPFEPFYDYSFDGVMRSFEDSLQRLGLDCVDIVFLHDPDVYVLETKQPHDVFLKAIDEAYRALDRLRADGSVKAIGLGVNDAQPIADALPRGQWDCFLLAGRYTLLEQLPLHSILPAVARHGASIVIGGPFNSGILAGRDTWNYVRAPKEIRDRVDGLAAVCATHGVELPAAALHFPIAHPTVAATIPGPRSAAEMKQILGWWHAPIPAALWQDMKARNLIDHEAPVPA